MFCCYSRLIVFTVIGLFWALDMSAEVLNKKSWLEATKICTLLGSKNKGEVQREKINITIDVPDDLYWIGAIVNQTLWFEVAGSVQVTGQGEKVDPPFLLSCHFYCTGQGDRFFALMGEKCSCQQPEAPGSSALFLLASVPPSKINGSIRGDCVAFTRTGSADYHELLPCSTPLPPICQNGVMFENKSWSEAVTSCNGRPAAKFTELSQYNISNGTTGWTGITRQNYGRIWATDQGEDTRLFGCIAVNVSSGNASLHEFPCDTKLTPLCEPGTTFKGTPSNEATETSGSYELYS